MQRTEIIIGLIAVVIATLVAFGVLKLIANPNLITGNRCQETSYIEVLVAKKDLRLGDSITLSALDYEKWPQQLARNEFFIKEKITKETFNGFVARRPISTGEPITPKMIVDSKNQGALAALLRPGMRAIAINVDPASISGGLIMPGDVVDVIITYGEGSATDRSIVSRTALCGVRVLALDQKISSESGGLQEKNKETTTTVPRTVTLEVTPIDAEALTAAVKKGTPSLSLHSVFNDKDQCRVNLHDEKASDVIQIYRGQQQGEGVQNFPVAGR